MSRETVQFVEMVREAFGRLVEQKFWMWCERCGQRQPHLLQRTGEWEHYTCMTCGARCSYRVR